MKTGDRVYYCGEVFTILVQYDDEYFYLSVGDDGAHLAHVSDLQIIH